MEMKRLSLSARHRAAHKAQENPYGGVVVMIFFLIAFLLASRSAHAQWADSHQICNLVYSIDDDETTPLFSMYLPAFCTGSSK